MTASRLLGNGHGTSLLARALDRQFALYRADTQELRDMCFRLRFEVYCLDNPFEPVGAQLDGLERDWLDSYSDHVLVVHRPTGLAVGTLRLILPSRLPASTELPFQKICGYRDPISRGLVPRTAVGEVSRIGIPLRVRHLLREASEPDERGDRSPTRRDDPAYRLPLLMLFRGFLLLAAGAGVTHLCAMIEPSLLRHYSRLGIVPDPIGPPVDYHGIRQPSFASIKQLLDRNASLRPDVWEAITAHGRFACDELPMIAAE